MRLIQRGDTIVEVMVAFTIFAMAAVAAVMIMNSGMAIAQRSLEVTLVRQQIDSQADMLRFVRDNDGSAWTDIKNSAIAVTDPDTEIGEVCPSQAADLPSDSFILEARSGGVNRVLLTGGGSFEPAQTYARFEGNNSYGLWIQPVRVDASAGTYDMYINTCWDTVGSEMPASVRTIVRLYDN